MRARGLALHDRENVRVERFDGRDRIAMVDLDPAILDRVDAVAARSCNRCSARLMASLMTTTLLIGSIWPGSNKTLAATFISAAPRARMPMVSSVGASGIAPATGTAP